MPVIRSEDSAIAGSRSCLLILAMLWMSAGVGCTAERHEINSAGDTWRRQDNLALGGKVLFSGANKYGLTKQGDSDSTDLTDGRVLTDGQLWLHKEAVGWSYGGQICMQLDLGKIYPVDEIGIRFQHGAPQDILTLPAYVELLGSIDGDRFYKLDRFDTSSWRDRQRFSVPPCEGKAIVVPLVFRNLNVRVRYVGFKVYCSGVTAADELWVLSGKAEKAGKAGKGGRGLKSFQRDEAFSVSQPALYTHHDSWVVDGTVALRNTLGLVIPPDYKDDGSLKLRAEIPAGLEMVRVSQGGEAGSELEFPVKVGNRGWDAKAWLLVWLKGQVAEKPVRFTLMAGEKVVSRIEVPLRQSKWRPLHQPCDSIFAAISNEFRWGADWYSVAGKLNLLSDEFGWRLGAKVSQVPDGRIAVVRVSPWLAATQLYDETRCVLGGAPNSQPATCPSYRGKHYWADIRSIAAYCAGQKARHIALDIETFKPSIPNARKCSRCREAFKKSNSSSIKEWLEECGLEMMRDLTGSIRKAYSKAGIARLPEISIYELEDGGRYNGVYQDVWSWKKLYPKYVQLSAPCIYATYEGYHLRKARRLCGETLAETGRADSALWLTPGDAGSTSGETFFWMSCEAFVAGARGLLFWSSRTWDAEMMLAVARALDAVAPVEDVILHGRPYHGARPLSEDIEVSGRKLGHKVVLIVEDYDRKVRGPVEVRVATEVDCVLVDLETDLVLGSVKKGDSSPITVDLTERPARILALIPAGQEPQARQTAAMTTTSRPTALVK